jgi:hypothetical protein
MKQQKLNTSNSDVRFCQSKGVAGYIQEGNQEVD